MTREFWAVNSELPNLECRWVLVGVCLKVSSRVLNLIRSFVGSEFGLDRTGVM